MAEISPKPSTNIERKYYIFALKIAGDFGVTIAAPVVIFALIGQKMDESYGTRPLYLVIGMAIAAVFTGLLIYKKAKKYGQQFQDLDKQK
ncbi:MAG: AtpZ/AtpI family protein [Candidatus Magasanikbacteria bacterium]|jgi:F0F1-type ATP synthase assembly protein I